MPFKNALFLDQTSILSYLGHEKHKQNYDIANKWISDFFEGNLTFDLLVTSDYVILSVAEILYDEGKDYENVLKFIENIIHSTSIKIININQDAFIEACRKIRIYHDIFGLDYSLTDATTLYILHSSRIRAVLSFNPQIHRLEYLLKAFDFDPDMDTSDEKLRYDAMPDIFDESEIKKNFLIKSKEVDPMDAIPLFELELSGWKIKNLTTNKGKVIELKLDYIYEKDITYNKGHLPEKISRLKHLVSLDISNNDISNLDDDILTIITSINSLSFLDLSQNDFKEIPTQLLNFQKKNKCKIII